MDVVSSCKDKLAYFRIKELKDVLTKLGLSKQGKKQDLIDRILAILSDDRVSSMWAKKNAVSKEEVAKLVDDTYRKMQVSGATDLASKGQGISDNSNVKLKEEREESYELDKTRCVCGSTLQTDSMIKCEDPRCHVWQHIGCVIIPQKPMEGVLPSPPEIFYCELCRLSRADPFWVAVAHPLYPVKLIATSIPTDGTNPVQSVEKTFQLTRADKDLLLKPEYDVQAWCMLLNDKVTFRMQWPQYADLQVNGVPVRAINRPGSQLLGANSRDDGPIITQCTRDGINKIALTGCDSRVFCLGVRIVKRRSVQQILNLIPRVSDGEQFEEALARVRRCVGGGAAAENADSDSDLEIVADSIPVNLRCPMSGSRMKIAGRFKPCLHMGCFDLEVFVEMNQRSRKWQCPICLKNYSLENIIIDPYFNRVTSKLRDFGEDVTEIEVKPDGSWRAKAEDRRDLGELGLWHLPDGALPVPMNGEVKPKVEGLQPIKQGVSEGHTSLKLGIKKNQNGLWEFSKPGDMHPLSACKLEKYDNHVQNVIPMSSSSGSGRDGEDASVNQDGCLNFDFSANNGIEHDSVSLNVDQTRQFANQSAAPFREAEVIVLSDSDEENDATVYDNGTSDGGVAFPMSAHGMPDPYTVDPDLGNAGTSCLGLFNTAEDDFGMPLWLPPGSQASTSFQLFGSDADVSDALVDLHHGPLNRPTPTSISGYTLTAETALMPELSADRRNADLNDGLLDNPMAFGAEDPSLQIFLPTKPSDSVIQPELRNQPDVSNSLRSDDWISLRLGGGGTNVHNEPASTTSLNTQQQSQSKEGAMDSLANTASLLHHGMNENRSGRRSREMSEGPFSFPRQRRSVRPRPFLSIDSDSN